MKNILIYGAGYVGLANAAALSKESNVILVDIRDEIIDNLRKGIVHIDDKQLSSNIKNIDIKFEYFKNISYSSIDLIILALPTNYDDEIKKFDTSYLDDQIAKIREETMIPILIKSTIPIGYTKSKNLQFNNILFSPEFLREGSSLKDAINPSRIIIGSKKQEYSWIGDLFLKVSDNNPRIIYMESDEAESVKLFANSYLAARVAFVNEVDSFAKLKGINSEDIIKGISSDPRIGETYFSPSAGYGGYCLPKDSKQLSHEFENLKMNNNLIKGVVNSNIDRRRNLVRYALENNMKSIDIDGIGHKPGVANYRNSPNLLLAKDYIEAGIEVNVYDNNFAGEVINGIKIKPKKV